VSVFLRGAPPTRCSWRTSTTTPRASARDRRRSGVRTAYTYDQDTYRLTRVLTTRPATNTTLQDLRYTYDPVGNPVEVHDDAQQTVYFDNAVVPPHLRYEYDALYRLVRAQGREHAGQNGRPSRLSSAPSAAAPSQRRPGTATTWRPAYDLAGASGDAASVRRAQHPRAAARMERAIGCCDQPARRPEMGQPDLGHDQFGDPPSASGRADLGRG
jgi:YD repeat-containing protein